MNDKEYGLYKGVLETYRMNEVSPETSLLRKSSSKKKVGFTISREGGFVVPRNSVSDRE